MLAISAPEDGDRGSLVPGAHPDPPCGPDELLVEVAATAVNRADVLQRKGLYPPPEGVTDVLGLELAGRVVEVGEQVAGWRVGDACCALVAGGAYAERCAVPADLALPLPSGLTPAEAAAVPEAFATAWDNLFRRGRATAGETVLVHGGASGVGTAAIQLLRRAGCRVLVTAGSPAKLDACRRLGADEAIDYRDEDFAERVAELTDGRGVDVVLDIVGGDYLRSNLRSLAVEGRLVIIGLMGGAKAEISLARLLSNRLTVTGSTLRSRTVAERAEVVADLREHVWPGFADGSLRPVIDRRLPWQQAGEAHRVMEDGEHVGKIVLLLGEQPDA